MIELIDEILRRANAGQPLAVCTVVRTRGSTPQKAGAVMVVLADGQTLGTIGGGCVEAEVRSRALELLPAENARLLTFKLDHDLGWDDGLVCGGTMEVAVQSIRSAESEAIDDLQTARDLLAAGTEATLCVEATDVENVTHRFERIIEPTPKLVIAGAGHVGVALADVCRRAGFEIVVIDDRADLVSPDRFPYAKRIVGEIEIELANYSITRHTFVVIVTRGHRHDGRALAAVVGSAAKYIGLIGSKRKIITIFKELREQGVPAEQLAEVHAPIGLDIGAITPEEIAVSIAAELIVVRRGAATAAPVMVARSRQTGSSNRRISLTT